VVALIAANLVPLYGVLFLDWKVFPIILLFWLENLVIGAINVLKMLLVDVGDPAKGLGKLFFVPFFCFHYGMFCFGHGVFVMGLFGGMFTTGAPFPTPDHVLRSVREYGVGLPLLTLAGSHLFSFFWNFLRGGERRTASLQRLMQQPYSRIVMLHLTLLGSGFLLMAFHSPLAGLVLLLVLKIVFDVRAHVRERNRYRSATQGNTSIPAWEGR
jgi:hypothetical protein